MSDLQPQSPAWQAWVAGQLAVPAGAGLPATRQAILARLEDADLAPSEQLLAAVRLGLAGQEAGGAPARAIATFAKAHREALAEAVEEFARNYWSLAPAAREAAHAELLAAAASAPLIRLRLEGLRAAYAWKPSKAPTTMPPQLWRPECRNALCCHRRIGRCNARNWRNRFCRTRAT